MCSLRLKKGVFLICFGLFFSQNCLSSNNGLNRSLTSDELEGKNYFDGNKKLENGGSSCISCHTVKNDNLIYGGLFAKDLTDVYSRMGEGIPAWLMAPPFPAMAIAYKNNALTENERMKITAFLKYADEVRETQKISTGFNAMLFAGGGGIVIIFLLVSLIWFHRKKKMVKEGIFSRQIKAWDAKH